ncbi:MAG: hypothetical protein ACRD1T_22290 [Acidimicrobiia bacterium]
MAIRALRANSLGRLSNYACPHCEVIGYNLYEECSKKARQYELKTGPAVVVNGPVVSSCDNRGP